MRKFSIEKDRDGLKRLFLNNQPLFQNGLLDQGYWPDGLYTAPTDQALRFDLEKAREMGFNMIRKHIKVEPARWYYHCDKIGLIVWQDMPSGGNKMMLSLNFLLPTLFPAIRIRDDNYKKMGRQDEENRLAFRKGLQDMVDALYNSPSIGMWIIFNEGWGQFDVEEIYNWLIKYDPSRYINPVSGWFDQGIGELKSIHNYFRKLKKPKDLGHRAFAVSEYGGYILPLDEHLWEGEKRFVYKKFRSPMTLYKAYEKLFINQVIPLINRGLSGVVYTQLTDVESEANGFISYDRKALKVNPEKLSKLHNRISIN